MTDHSNDKRHETPRADAAVIHAQIAVGEYADVVPVEDARELERELAEARDLANRETLNANYWKDKATVAPSHVASGHAVTCKMFPDPYDERDPVGPCTCGLTPSATRERCGHDWVSARNQAVTSGEVCTKCFAVRAEPVTVEPGKCPRCGSTETATCRREDCFYQPPVPPESRIKESDA